MELEPLDWVHAVTAKIPDRGQHLVHYYGWYSNRCRGARRKAGSPIGEAAASRGPAGGSRASWARLLRHIFEVEPLLCPRCGVEMKVVSVLTHSVVVDKILHHFRQGRSHDLFAERPPPIV